VITQLNPPLPMETRKGRGGAHFVNDYGPEAAPPWVVFMDPDGTCWTVTNSGARKTFNWTIGRGKPEQAEKPRNQQRARRNRCAKSFPDRSSERPRRAPVWESR